MKLNKKTSSFIMSIAILGMMFFISPGKATAGVGPLVGLPPIDPLTELLILDYFTCYVELIWICSDYCTPDCSCSANTCVGDTCDDGCNGAVCQGTKGANCDPEECGNSCTCPQGDRYTEPRSDTLWWVTDAGNVVGSYCAPPNADPIGWHEYNVDCGADGWAYDGDVPNDSISVHVYRDGQVGSGGTLIGGYTTDFFREDVNNALGGISGNHGFQIRFPNSGESAALYDGNAHNLYIYAINQPNGNNPLLPMYNNNPRSIQCSAAVTPLPCPTNFNASCDASGTQATISWNALKYASGYVLRANKDPYGDWFGPGDLWSEPVNPSQVLNITPGVNYQYDVQGKKPGEVYPYAGARCPAVFNCAAPIATQGECGTDVGVDTDNAPTNPGLCNNGTVIIGPSSVLGSWVWICGGPGLTSSPDCRACDIEPPVYSCEIRGEDKSCGNCGVPVTDLYWCRRTTNCSGGGSAWTANKNCPSEACNDQTDSCSCTQYWREVAP
jgi:hypothetical protein